MNRSVVGFTSLVGTFALVASLGTSTSYARSSREAQDLSGSPQDAAGLLPDPSRTPGATNPDITQDNIDQTICNPHWSTKSVRPPASYTTNLKKGQLADGYTYQGDTDAQDYEEDHFIALEIGGNPRDPKNLWPEPWERRGSDLAPPGTGAESKDVVENALHKEVCGGVVTLQRAQEIITTNWMTCYNTLQDGEACK